MGPAGPVIAPVRVAAEPGDIPWRWEDPGREEAAVAPAIPVRVPVQEGAPTAVTLHEERRRGGLQGARDLAPAPDEPSARPATAAPPSLSPRAALAEDDADDAAFAGELQAMVADSERPADVPLAVGMRGLREPSWIHPPARNRSPLRLLWRLSLLLLLAALLTQLAVMRAGPLAAAWPQSRPIVALIWQQIGREPPWQRDLERLRVLRSDVRDNPERPGSLLVTVTLQNEASFEQPFPAIELTLGDATGALVGRRRFESALYLGPDWPPPAFMPLGRPVDVVLELADSHGRAAAFTIELR